MNINDAWEGQKVQIVSSDGWGWWCNHIGEIHTVIEVRKRYDDVCVVGGNCIDIECIEPVK